MSKAQLIFNKQTQHYVCHGDWDVHNGQTLAKVVRRIPYLKIRHVFVISGEKLERLDSAGALMLLYIAKSLAKCNYNIEFINFTDKQQKLISTLKPHYDSLNPKDILNNNDSFLVALGKEVIKKIQQTSGFLKLVADITNRIIMAVHEPARFRLVGIVSVIESAGLKSLPILALLSFLIGVVLAYQMGLQLESYGANVFIAYLSGMAIFREFGPLITAIIVAGRTSSAFTAQIGTMKVRQEVDALVTMGISEIEVLIVPKMFGLLIVFPLLIFWSDIFGALGSMIMAKFMLDVSLADFMVRLHDSVGASQLFLGVYKAPMFAILIALVGCYQGFCVEANAESVGIHTTKAVVQSLFLIIITDAIYSVIYGALGL
jgi:phospholipid/cholesterol/gamma-HCH transport system permease protein